VVRPHRQQHGECRGWGVAALMPARRTALRQLFSKGQVTDTDSADLAPDMAESLRDCVWTANGDLSKRGGFLYATGANPIDADTTSLTSCVLTAIPDATTPNTFTYKLLVGDSTNYLGVLDAYTYAYGTPNASTTAVKLNDGFACWPLMEWQNEVLYALNTGSYYALKRWGKSTATEDLSPTGTVTVTTGSDEIAGGGTSFLAEVTAGQYINVQQQGINYYFLVTKVTSNTSLQISGKAQVTISAATFLVVNIAETNISTLLTNKGTVTTGVNTATGKGTSWDTGLDSLNGGGWICGVNATTRYGIGTVTDDDTVGVIGTPGLTDSNYVAGRALVGNIVTAHAGRLWVAGVAWAPNRVQVTPVNHNLSDVFNAVDSSTTDPDNAAIIESIEIPDDKSPGFITGLASGNDPGPLVVTRDRDAYIVYGEWPSVQVTKLGEDIGCAHWQGITFHDRRFYWAGVEGVFTYAPGGGVRNLTEGKIYREWKAAIGGKEITTAVVEVVNRTLFVTVTLDDASNFGYMLDLEREAWSTLTDTNWAAGTEVVVAGQGRDVFVTELGTNRVVSLRAATDPAYAGTANSLQGSFLARSGRMLMGSAGDLGRVVDSRVTYRMTSGSSPQFTVKYGSVSLNTAATVTTTTSGTAYATTRIKPGSTNLGTSARDMQVEFAESSGTPARLEINEFSWVTRERRKRA
jgi:hypothetical protein